MTRFDTEYMIINNKIYYGKYTHFNMWFLRYDNKPDIEMEYDDPFLLFFGCIVPSWSYTVKYNFVDKCLLLENFGLIIQNRYDSHKLEKKRKYHNKIYR